MVLNLVKIWAAGTLSRTEERHHSVARVREQLDGSAGAPGGAHREPGAHVAVRNQRVESLQRVRDKRTSLPDARCVWKLSANSSFSPCFLQLSVTWLSWLKWLRRSFRNSGDTFTGHLVSRECYKEVFMFTSVVLLVHRKQIQDLNWQRKNDQLAGGAKLRELESK